METQTNTKEKKRSVERVVLSQDALLKLSEWLSELQQTLKGCRISKTDLVNYLISSHPATFSIKEKEELKAKYFDDVRFAEWAIKQIKAAKTSGSALSLSALLDKELPKIIPGELGKSHSNTQPQKEKNDR